jgi:hypothetical protein
MKNGSFGSERIVAQVSKKEQAIAIVLLDELGISDSAAILLH